MKKLLFGTTALVTGAALMSGPAVAEEGIKLGLGGYMNNYFGVLFSDDNDADTDYNATGLFSDGEIWFKGETTLDNGITFGANVQLESFTTGDQIDENFGYVSGSFGRLNFGSENTAMYLMQYTAPYVGAPINSGWVSTFIPSDGTSRVGVFRSPEVSTRIDIGNDENQITYFTPRFSGFQVGVSYAPSVNGSGDGKNFPIEADKDFEFNNGFTAGVNFVESFDGIDVAVAGGYGRAEAPDTASAVTNDPDDQEMWSVGANVGFSGFTVGGSYADRDDDTMDGDAWDIGATYATGPWSIGGQYFSSDVDHDPSGVDNNSETQAVVGGVGYAIGPGISTSASVMWTDYDTDGGDADGVIGIVGITYSF